MRRVCPCLRRVCPRLRRVSPCPQKVIFWVAVVVATNSKSDLVHSVAIRARSDMQNLASRTDSSSTLLRGTTILRQNSMTLEGDERYQEMIAERDRLLDALT